MADKKITPKAASSKDKASDDRAAARVSQRRLARKASVKVAKRSLRKM